MSLHKITKREKVIVMLAVMSGLFLVALDQTIISTALGAIVKDFQSFSSLGFVVTAYMLTSTVTVPLAGKLSDMYGRRPILLAGIIVFTLASLLSGQANSMNMLIAARAIQGIGGGMIMANAFTIVGDLFPPRERSKWQGLIGATFGLSSVLGPLLGGWLTDGHSLLGFTTNWRWNFFINVPIGIVAGIIVARFCPTIKHDSVHKPDYLGALFVTVALAALILGVDNTEAIFRSVIDGGVSLIVIRSLLLGLAAVATIAFVITERKAKQPILPLRFFKNNTYVRMTAVTMLFGAAFMGAILYLTQFNQQVYGADATEAGLMLLPMVIGMTASSITAGQLIAKAGRYKPFIVFGFAIGTAALLSLVTLQADSPYWHEAISMVFIGLGFGMAMPVLNIAIQNEFEQKDLGAATASVQLFRGLGSTIGIAILSAVLTSGIINTMGEPSKNAYIQTLKNSAGSHMVSDPINTDTLLNLNTQKERIYQETQSSVKDLPKERQESILGPLRQLQDSFSQQVVGAFTKALHSVFLVSASLMAIALAVLLGLKNRKLRSKMETGIVLE